MKTHEGVVMPSPKPDPLVRTDEELRVLSGWSHRRSTGVGLYLSPPENALVLAVIDRTA
ncbi:hypothetical protein [Amycolatopsis pigmentata]|uniref:Uncharacterized protein n=1 Tax=Amycolatopsis pigmentata TaxID=450801 RepID=A0ABW5FN55_9PSEU